MIERFPNRANPNEITAQAVRLSVPADPKANATVTPLLLVWNFGVSLSGIMFAPWLQNSGTAIPQRDGAIALGLDAKFAHVQPNGKCHYHGPRLA